MADKEPTPTPATETEEIAPDVPDDEGVVKKKRVMTEKQLEVLKLAREKALAHRKEKAAEAQKKKETESAAAELQRIKMDEFAKSVQDELDAAKKKRDGKKVEFEEDQDEKPGKRARVKKQAEPKKKTKRKAPSDDEWADFDDKPEPSQKPQRRIEPERMPYSYGMPSGWLPRDAAREAYDRRIAEVKRNLVYRSVLPF